MDENSTEFEKKSKSQIKRELESLRLLGKELVSLSSAELGKLPLASSLEEAVIAARSMSKGALKRQLQYIGKLLRQEDAEGIRAALTALRQPQQAAVDQLHQLEQWRDRLIADEDGVFDELVEKFADIDRQHVRQLVRNANREKKANKSPKSARLLFQYLKSMLED